jgi:hypothetical protein
MACFDLCSRFAMAAEPAKPTSAQDKTPTSILANSDFSKGSGIKPESWDIDPEALSAKQVSRQPKSADSQDWILAVKPGTYVVCSQAVIMTPGQKYTLKVIARSLGEDSTLGVVQYDPPDTVVQILWQTPLTKEFQPYVKTFTASPKIKRITLYSVAPGKQGGAGQDALEIAGAYLYEGEVDRHGSTVPVSTVNP